MSFVNNQYGRKRIKKSKPAIVPAIPKSEPDAEETKSTVASEKPETQLPIELPLPDKDKGTPAEPDSGSAAEIRPESESGSALESRPPIEPAADARQEVPSGRPRREERRAERGDRFRQPQRQERKRESPRPKSRDRQQIRKFGTERVKTRVSIIVPAYNEEGNIKPLMDQFHEVIARAGSDWEVILVDDGSTDKTAERARDAAFHYHWLRIISYTRNRGLTAALDTGFQNARGSIFVFYPADLQYHPQDIPRMIARIDRGADIVTGWKQGGYSKRFVSSIYNYLCRSLFGIKVHDLNSVKAFRKEVLEKVNLRRDWHRYMVVLAAEEGYSVDEVKINVYPRFSGRSKFGTGRILGGLLDLLSVKFQISFTKKPLRFFGTWGLVAVILGIVTGLVAIYLRLFTTHGSRTWLYLVILFILSGLMLFSLGFLAEVIVSIREEIESLRRKK
jgi:glycosyltransferase involved in cell wall biosynthesis